MPTYLLFAFRNDNIPEFDTRWDVVKTCLSSSSDDHHLLHSCLGTGMRGGAYTCFVIILHLWFIRRSHFFLISLLVCWWCSITILPLLVHNIRTFATVTTPVPCVFVNTLQYHDTVDFAQDSETEDPQLVAEPRVGRNHGKTMGTH